jgi:carbonic anhydrase/acetyltransferase-like protein (isoleucine patch superfamily)
MGKMSSLYFLYPHQSHISRCPYSFCFIGVLRDEEIAGHTVYSYLYETGYFLSVHNLHLYMKATFDILRRWSHPLVPEIIASIHKQPLSTVTTPTSPQIKSHDPYSLFYNTSYPIIYDKHNIYKQGDVQLDRLSDIQQDVFIGHKSQILSGVCLRSSLIGQNCIIGKNTRIENSIIWNHVQIGENCIIKNSIICDNVLIRNNVQIDKECFLCKGVIIGTDVHLNERMTIIASNPTMSTNLTDEIEIDDDIQLPPENFKRSNSKQRRSSARSSDKSFSERSVSLSIEDTITSNSDLVGADGLGKELIFNSINDERTAISELTEEEEEDDDDDDNDKNQLNAFDAWGYRMENKDLSVQDDDDVANPIGKRAANLPKPSAQPSDIPSDDESGDITDDNDESSTGDESINNENEVSEFQQEVIRTLERAYTQKLKIENIIVELNMLKPTYDVSPTEFDQSITRAVFLLPCEKKISNSEKPDYWKTLKLTMDQITQFILKNYMKTTNQEAQMSLLNELDLICLKHIQPIGERIVNILNYLYEGDVIDEKWILQWYENKRNKIENKQLIIKEEEKIYYDKVKQFIEWLQNAESEEEEED